MQDQITCRRSARFQFLPWLWSTFFSSMRERYPMPYLLQYAQLLMPTIQETEEANKYIFHLLTLGRQPTIRIRQRQCVIQT